MKFCFWPPDESENLVLDDFWLLYIMIIIIIIIFQLDAPLVTDFVTEQNSAESGDDLLVGVLRVTFGHLDVLTLIKK